MPCLAQGGQGPCNNITEPLRSARYSVLVTQGKEHVMRIEYSDRLKEYMDKKGKHDLLMYIQPPQG